MSIRILAALSLALVLVAGCQSAFSQRLKQTFTYRGGQSSRENPADEPSDPWINDAGNVARTEHPSEEINDPLNLRQYFMSQRARDIERNLGVGE